MPKYTRQRPEELALLQAQLPQGPEPPPKRNQIERRGRYEPDVSKLQLPGLAAFLERSGISQEEYARWSMADPEFPIRLKRKVREQLSLGILGVWDALLKEALTGSVPAIRLYLEAFDESFQKQKALEAAGASGMLPSRDEFVRLMKAQLGDDVWAQAEEAARLAGKKHGPLNVELLPGGDLEDERVIDAAVLPAEKPTPLPDDEEWPFS